jgi:hypothetical protein
VHQEVENAKNDNINQEFKENLNHMHCNDNYSTYPFYTEDNNIKSFPILILHLISQKLGYLLLMIN